MIDVLNLSMQYDGKYLFRESSFKINIGDKIALVGLNGTGKSTLLKILNEFEESDGGAIQKQKLKTIGYLSQEFVDLKGKTVFEEVRSSLKKVAHIDKKEFEIQTSLSDKNLSDNEKESLILQLGEIEHLKTDIEYYSIDSRIEKVLEGLGFSQKDFSRLIDEFSGGWQMRVELAKILLENHDLIMLDEPTNHLDIDSLNWITDYLKQFKGAVLIVSHDRNFVNEVTDKTLEIFNGKISFFNGNYQKYILYKEEREAQLRAMQKGQEKKIKETEKFIERFRYKASKARQVQSRIKQLEKFEKIELTDDPSTINLRFPTPPRIGDVPLDIVDASKNYGKTHVFSDVNLKLTRGDKIAFLGPNGAGKTTLAKIIANKTSLSSGKIIIGANTSIAYYAQEVTEELNPDNDILDEVSEANSEYNVLQIRSLVGNFMFTGDEVFKKVGVLSGGEKSRVALAKLLLQKANFIILDEPTNHLDYFSKKILQEALINFSGNLVIVSHDIDFVRPICNFCFDIRNGGAKLYHGGIDYYLRKRLEETNLTEGTITQAKTKTKDIVENPDSKKEKKRIEAELRNKRYNATKDLMNEISKIETSISELESKKEDFEKRMNDEKTFENPTLIKETTLGYKETSSQLETLYKKWEEKNLYLEELNKEFSL